LRERGPDVSLEAAPVPVKSSDKPEAAIATALTTLLTAPADKSATTIPPGTQLRGITVKPEGIYVNLSKEFTAGGGSLSMYGRVGQVLYTATSLDPKAPVFLQVEGKPLETLGGEGLIIDQPLTRSLFEQGSGQKGE
jgi:spore germination protein GerM